MNKKQKVNSKKKSDFSPGILVLENKSIFNGIGIGYEGTATGEVCFNTSITGYQEIISDPSYAGQIILSLIHISEPTRQEAISYAVFCLKKKNNFSFKKKSLS